MMSSSSAFPELTPLKRLIVKDGLLLNAERWRLSHDYHRQRQNIHFQSLFSAGIVQGLGVRVIEPPSEVARPYQDHRWLQIQPGLAIDGHGNPIIVAETINFRLVSQVYDQPQTIYLVIGYVDPETLQSQNYQDIAAETFRLKEKSTLPTAEEVELCRVVLSPQDVQLQRAANVFLPQINEPDLRFRPAAQIKSPQSLVIAPIAAPGPSLLHQAMDWLLPSIPHMYPQLQVRKVAEAIALGTVEDGQLQGVDVLYGTSDQWLELGPAAVDQLQRHTQQGGMILCKLTHLSPDLEDLLLAMGELQQGIETLALGRSPQDQDLKLKLMEELAACEATWRRDCDRALQPLDLFFQQLSMERDELPLPPGHPVQTQPFLFSRLPVFQGQPLQLFSWQGAIAFWGDLEQFWYPDPQNPVPRVLIREAQEITINLLHYFALRRRLHQAQ